MLSPSPQLQARLLHAQKLRDKRIKDRRQRIKIANRILEEISYSGDRLFWNPHTRTFGKFHLDQTQVVFIDQDNGQVLNVSQKSGGYICPPDFSGTPGQWALLRELNEFIHKGTRSNGKYGEGLNAEWAGYTPNDMRDIRELANQLGYHA